MSFCMSCRATGASVRPRISVIAVAIAVLAGGCAANNPGPSRVAGPISSYPGDPAAHSSVPRAASVEMEADGFPVQVVPKNRRPMRDDPSEPWSPNYGTVRPDNRAAAPVSERVATATRATPVATQSVAPRLEPDDIIRLAIAEHEMRQR